MKVSKNCLELISFFEGKRNTPYLCSASVATIGIGHVLYDPITKVRLTGVDGLKRAKEIYPKVSDEQIQLWLKEDLKDAESKVNTRVRVALSQNQFDALVSHTFNTGGSTSLFALVNANYPSSNALKSWWTERYITANGKVLRGLIKRREVEYELFDTGKLNLK